MGFVVFGAALKVLFACSRGRPLSELVTQFVLLVTVRNNTITKGLLTDSRCGSFILGNGNYKRKSFLPSRDRLFKQLTLRRVQLPFFPLIDAFCRLPTTGPRRQGHHLVHF